MRDYEVMYIINPELDEEQTTAVLDKFKGIVENNGGEIVKLDKWGKRRLAYEIKRKREGFYVLMNIKGTPEIVHELDRVFKITDEIMKHMILRDDE